jgi:hypothetical protein
MRHGIANWLDAAVHVGGNFMLGADAKIGAVQSKSFDLAIVPGLGILNANWTYFHVPVVFGINPSDDFHVYFGPRVTFAQTFAGDWRTWSGTHPHPPDGTVPGGVLALRFGRAHGFWVQPEYDFMLEEAARDQSPTLATHHFFSVTFGFPTKYTEDE